ncbi:MAG: ABC transporter ATP-binding protein [Solirubrobacteraceae bacterium]
MSPPGGGGGRGPAQWDGTRPSSGSRGRNLRGLLELLAPYRLRVAGMLSALLVGTAAGLVPPLLTKIAIDRGIDKHATGTLAIVVVVFLISAVLLWAMTYAQTYLVGWVGQRALADLRIRIFKHLQSQPVGFYESRPAGVLISRMTNDVEALENLVTDSVVTLFQSGLTLLGAIAVLLYLDWELALLTFCIIPFVAGGSIWFRLVSASAFRRTRETIGAITAYLQESLSGVRVVRSFGQEARHERIFATLNEDNVDANMTTVRLNAAYFPAVEMLSGVALAVIVLYGGYQAISGQITAGTVVAFVATMSYLFEPIQQLSQLYTTYQSGMAALEKIFQLLDVKPELSDAPDAIELPPLRGEIAFEDVTFAYGARRRSRRLAVENGADRALALALDDVSLHVEQGETVALVGATGAGKSTMVKLLARYYDPTDGRVLIDGYDLRRASSRSLRSQMGIVPQEAFLFAGTVRENIAFGRPDATIEQVRAAADAVGAHELIESLEHGYDTEIGERGGQLSAGQRQLIAFARALIADPRILVLDEATSNVDLHTESRIEAGLRTLLSGRTAIVIAHRLSTIRGADRIVLLEHGRIVEQGTHEQLIEAGGHYSELHGDWATQAAA